MSESDAMNIILVVLKRAQSLERSGGVKPDSMQI